MSSSTKLAFKYAMFAVVATVANIGAQDWLVSLYSGFWSIGVSIVVGTVVGLVVKYLLDKRFIFGFQARDAAHDTQVFVLYTVMGLATTVVFWGVELGFYLFFETKEMRYLGGVIGLAIGYVAKYHLDKRYVFRQEFA